MLEAVDYMHEQGVVHRDLKVNFDRFFILFLSFFVIFGFVCLRRFFHSIFKRLIFEFDGGTWCWSVFSMEKFSYWLLSVSLKKKKTKIKIQNKFIYISSVINMSFFSVFFLFLFSSLSNANVCVCFIIKKLTFDFQRVTTILTNTT